jgi:L-seryl-tRNA(Ser) seleniumtransferase
MPSEALGHGADLVTFSGDKLLGGPQAGIIVGRADLVNTVKRNAMKRALRVDKMTVAALASTLALYEDPDRLADRLPVLRDLVRPVAEIRAAAHRLRDTLANALKGAASVDVIDCSSQIGSGALPAENIASAGLSIRPRSVRSTGTTLNRISKAFRHLPVPVIGRIHDDAFILDIRCLDDEETFLAQLSTLDVTEGAG